MLSSRCALSPTLCLARALQVGTQLVRSDLRHNSTWISPRRSNSTIFRTPPSLSSQYRSFRGCPSLFKRPKVSSSSPIGSPTSPPSPSPSPSSSTPPSSTGSAAAPSKLPRSGSNTSLRRVAVEAERVLGGYLRQRGTHQFIDPNVVTKKVIGYCAAERYNIAHVTELVKQEGGYSIDPFNTGLYPQVLHIQTPIYPSTFISTPSDLNSSRPDFKPEHGDVFIFPSGTVVSWNMPEADCARLVQTVLAPAAENLQSVEQDSFDYFEDPTKESSSVVGDTIVLGIHDPSLPLPSDTTINQDGGIAQSQSINTILTKIAFASGLARSTKLQVLETLLDRYFESTRNIPSTLTRGQPLPFGRRSILRKIGELLHIRAQLNLYSELTDSLPDLFWDSRHALGLEDYFDNIGRALDVGVRIKLLNQRMDYAQEMAAVLREQLSEKHGLRLEWAIIILILIEVLFECRSIWKEYRVDAASRSSISSTQNE